MPIPQPRGSDLNAVIADLETALSARFVANAGVTINADKFRTLWFIRSATGGRLYTYCPEAKSRVPLAEARLDVRCEAVAHLERLLRELLREQEQLCLATDEAIAKVRRVTEFLSTETPS